MQKYQARAPAFPVRLCLAIGISPGGAAVNSQGREPLDSGVCRGLGVVKYPVRFDARPEITVFTLQRATV
jgi:hypothetical protein